MAQVQSQPLPPAARPGSILRAEAVAKTFRMGDSRIEILRNVSLNVPSGEFLAIEGRSGSGKSTLLHLLGALDECDSGRIIFDGANFADLGSAARGRIRNRQFGFVFQFYHLLPELNVLENTLLSPMIELSWLNYMRQKRELKTRALEVLNWLGMEGRLRHRPSQLSGGERQRVAIARALMNRPRVLFADEPTGNLDAETGKQIMGVLERLHATEAQTIIMVTHDRSLAKRADRVLVLRDGALHSTET